MGSACGRPADRKLYRNASLEPDRTELGGERLNLPLVALKLQPGTRNPQRLAQPARLDDGARDLRPPGEARKFAGIGGDVQSQCQISLGQLGDIRTPAKVGGKMQRRGDRDSLAA